MSLKWEYNFLDIFSVIYRKANYLADFI